MGRWKAEIDLGQLNLQTTWFAAFRRWAIEYARAKSIDLLELNVSCYAAVFHLECIKPVMPIRRIGSDRIFDVVAGSSTLFVDWLIGVWNHVNSPSLHVCGNGMNWDMDSLWLNDLVHERFSGARHLALSLGRQALNICPYYLDARKQLVKINET